MEEKNKFDEIESKEENDSNEKLITEIYCNPEYVQVCSDVKFWEEYYSITKDYTIGMYENICGNREIAINSVRKTINIYKKLKSEDSEQTTTNIKRHKYVLMLCDV